MRICPVLQYTPLNKYLFWQYAQLRLVSKDKKTCQNKYLYCMDIVGRVFLYFSQEARKVGTCGAWLTELNVEEIEARSVFRILTTVIEVITELRPRPS